MNDGAKVWDFLMLTKEKNDNLWYFYYDVTKLPHFLPELPLRPFLVLNI